VFFMLGSVAITRDSMTKDKYFRYGCDADLKVCLLEFVAKSACYTVEC